LLQLLFFLLQLILPLFAVQVELLQPLLGSGSQASAANP